MNKLKSKLHRESLHPTASLGLGGRAISRSNSQVNIPLVNYSSGALRNSFRLHREFVRLNTCRFSVSSPNWVAGLNCRRQAFRNVPTLVQVRSGGGNTALIYY